MIDDERRHSPVSLFYEKAKQIGSVLTPGQVITPDDLPRIGSPQLVVVGNSRLRPDCFVLRLVDAQPLAGTFLPGKSGMLDFYGLGHHTDLPGDIKDVFTCVAFGKPPDRHDYIWHTDLERLTECNFKVIFAPVNNNPLHIRFVHSSHLAYTSPIYFAPETPLYDRQRVTTIWRRKK